MNEHGHRKPKLRVLSVLAGTVLAAWFVAGCTVETTVQSGGSLPATAAPTALAAEPTAQPTAEPAATATTPPTPTVTPSATPAPSPTPEPTATPDVEQVLGDTLEGVRAAANLPPGASIYDEFVDLADDDGLIFVTVPATWTDTDGRNWDYDDALIGPALSASPDLDAFVAAWGTPGLFLAASDELGNFGVEAFLDEFWFGESCTYLGRYDYNDGLYVGLFDAYVECGAEGSAFLQVIAEPADGSYLVQAQFLIASDSDWLAVERAINTFTAMVAEG